MLKNKSKRKPYWMESYNQSYAFGTLGEDEHLLLMNAGRGLHDYWAVVHVPNGIMKIKPDAKTGIKKVSPLVMRQAKKMAESRLAKAKKFLAETDPDAFYTETNRSLIDYFADRYNLPAFGLTADKIKEFAAGKQSDLLIDQLLGLLQQCDFGRFAPGGSEKTQMEHLWDEARQLIVELEKTR